MKRIFNIKWTLVLYDMILFLVVDVGLFAIYHKFLQVGWRDVIINSALAILSIFACRFFGNIYGQIWRWGYCNRYE